MENQRVVFLRGETTILRPYCEETDLALFTQWFNDPETRDHLGSFMLPTTQMLEQTLMRERATKKDPNEVFLVIEQMNEPGKPVGTAGLHRINWISRTATTGSCIGPPELRSKGLGTDAKVALLRYAFDSLGLRMINSTVIGFNKRSQRALIKQGYREVGCIPDWHYRKGRFWDDIIFVLTREAFEAAHPKKA